MGKKIIYGIAIIVIIVGAILTFTMGLNLSTEYNENTKVYVYIGTQFENKEIKQIASEVFETNKVIVKKIDVYEDMACIILEKQNEENINEKIENLNNKLNEKYGLENKSEDIIIKNEPKINVYTILKPYIYPVIINTIIIIIYAVIMFRKIGFIKTVINYVLAVLGSLAFYISVIAITRLPVSKYTAPIGIIIYIVAITTITIKKQRQLENYKLKQK